MISPSLSYVTRMVEGRQWLEEPRVGGQYIEELRSLRTHYRLVVFPSRPISRLPGRLTCLFVTANEARLYKMSQEEKSIFWKIIV
jgi:hypothetical protein